ncbi:MAG: GntR family transcriptional regulator [Gemmataceae bacterium]|nr:GntR family transcriptional regulator [Gemmataceae bacterium]
MLPTTPETSRLPIERRASLKDAAYRQIKDLLVSGGLQQGRLYSAPYFAEMLGVSRTPVREALLQLTSEGFLVCLDVRGFKVKEFSSKEIRDVFETREVIECYVIGRLVEEVQPEDLRQMQDSLRTMTACAAKGDAVGFVEADKEFHMVPVRRCGNLHLGAIMDNIRSHMSVLCPRALLHEGRYQEVLREHAAILGALRHKDRKRAVQAVRHHLTATEGYLCDRDEK